MKRAIKLLLLSALAIGGGLWLTGLGGTVELRFGEWLIAAPMSVTLVLLVVVFAVLHVVLRTIGDLQVEMFFKYLGFSFSRYFTHAGQQEVNIGNGPPFFRRSRNSSDSAIVVKSAPNVVSYTSSTPMSLSAVTSLSSTFSPAGKPNASPTATRTAGAI